MSPGTYGNFLNPKGTKVNYNKFFVAVQAALAVAATSLAPFVSGEVLAGFAIAQAFFGALFVSQVSNEPKSP